jgi:23S rRNA pseudouridine1911/1915/1917 synthase
MSKRRDASDRRQSDHKKEKRNQVRAKAYKQADMKRTPKRPKRDESGALAETPTQRKSGDGEKAYKLLAIQEDISNAQAKNLIDRGLVYAGNRKVMIARGELPMKTVFTVQRIERIKPLFENADLIVVDKPAYLNAEEVERQFPGTKLLHRLDRETSGVLMLSKNEAFRERAIEAFKKNEVYKEYVAWVEGMITDPQTIDAPLVTEKIHNRAFTKVSKAGKPAHTEVYPLEIAGKKSKVKVLIREGRTHQIRAHLKSVHSPIIGDEQYGGKSERRVMLHAKCVRLLGMEFIAEEPGIFRHYSG